MYLTLKKLRKQQREPRLYKNYFEWNCKLIYIYIYIYTYTIYIYYINTYNICIIGKKKKAIVRYPWAVF